MFCVCCEGPNVLANCQGDDILLYIHMFLGSGNPIRRDMKIGLYKYKFYDGITSERYCIHTKMTYVLIDITT